MGSQIEDADIFSMCNCLTIGMPRVYTAHAMTMDMFLDDKVYPGARVFRPHTKMWTRNFVKVFKIPERVKIFLFSTFNEVYLPSYMQDEVTRCTIGFNDSYAALRKLFEPVGRFPAPSFVDRLKLVGEKVARIWGSNVLKILVQYDTSRASQATKDLFSEYDLAVSEGLSWPVVKVPDGVIPASLRGKPDFWCHCGEESIAKLYDAILSIESEYNNAKKV